MENSSGQGKNSDVPSEIQTWNWGAFFLNALWGLFNGTYIALLSVIPVVGILMAFVLGFKGNEWAWQNKRWKSIEQFQRVQKLWALCGIILVLVGTILSIFVVNVFLPILKIFGVIPK
jgi:heme/copper-type cytochrome/quinol oxidase subunit 2